jgi:catechol 2,3-dioxygenase-like lactoylglutathione lyase family enzyme
MRLKVTPVPPHAQHSLTHANQILFSYIDIKRTCGINFRQCFQELLQRLWYTYSSTVFEKGQNTMKKTRLQHVSCAVPTNAQDIVRAFYGGVLGLEEKPTPQALAALNVIWFSVGDNKMELHFIPDPILADPLAQYHFCLEVSDLEQYRARLTEAGYITTEATPIINRPRFFCRDPFNNLVEFTMILGSYD